MTARCAPVQKPNPLYFVEVRARRRGGQNPFSYFLELDRDENSASAVHCLIRHDDSVIRVLEIIEPCEDFPRGQCLDVTNEMHAEALGLCESLEYDQQVAKWDHDRDLRKHDAD